MNSKVHNEKPPPVPHTLMRKPQLQRQFHFSNLIISNLENLFLSSHVHARAHAHV